MPTPVPLGLSPNLLRAGSRGGGSGFGHFLLRASFFNGARAGGAVGQQPLEALRSLGRDRELGLGGGGITRRLGVEVAIGRLDGEQHEDRLAARDPGARTRGTAAGLAAACRPPVR